MKYYRLTYLISPELAEEEAKKIQEDLNSLVQGKNGILTSGASNLIKKNLGSPIQKKKSAYLGSLEFGLEVEKVVELQKELKEKKEILRFMLIFKKPTKPEEEKKPRRKKPEQKEDKIELKAMDDKLDEILDK